ncbi:CDC27 family protein [Candidatus Woesearchaeota archaeon]|nr:CDC27 family protein [Candidatus Woesearchaeota archaeon]
MEEEEKLKIWVDNARHWLKGAKKETKPGQNATRIVETENELVKALFALSRFYHASGNYAQAIPLLQEAQELIGPSTESKYFLADSLSKIGKWEEAYEVFWAAHGKTGLQQWKHPIYDDPELILDDLNKLFIKCIDNCSRLQQPVTESEYINWHWNKRFKGHKELEWITSRYHRRDSKLEVQYHPFDFVRFDRRDHFDGLTDKGIPFEIEEKPVLTLDQRIKVICGSFLTLPNSNKPYNEQVEDWAAWLEVKLIKSKK